MLMKSVLQVILAMQTAAAFGNLNAPQQPCRLGVYFWFSFNYGAIPVLMLIYPCGHVYIMLLECVFFCQLLPKLLCRPSRLGLPDICISSFAILIPCNHT